MPVGNIFGASTDTSLSAGSASADVTGSLTAGFGPSGGGASRGQLLSPAAPLGLTTWLGVGGLLLLVWLHYVVPA